MRYTPEQINEMEDRIGNILMPAHLRLTMALHTKQIKATDIKAAIRAMEKAINWVRSQRR